jgi:hypothetical protein
VLSPRDITDYVGSEWLLPGGFFANAERPHLDVGPMHFPIAEISAGV